MSRPLAILFDLDATLTDRPATLARFAAAFVDRFGSDLRFDVPIMPPVQRVATAIAATDGGGHALRAGVFAHLRTALPWTTPPGAGVLEAFWSEEFPACARPASGLLETLEGLRGRGVRVGVVTNGGPAAQRRKLDAIGVRWLVAPVVISGAVGVRKPDPRIFALALGAMDMGAADAWFVGDHPMIDVRGARSAGLTAVWRGGTRPWPADDPPPDHAIAGLRDLLPLLG